MDKHPGVSVSSAERPPVPDRSTLDGGPTGCAIRGAGSHSGTALSTKDSLSASAGSDSRLRWLGGGSETSEPAVGDSRYHDLRFAPSHDSAGQGDERRHEPDECAVPPRDRDRYPVEIRGGGFHQERKKDQEELKPQEHREQLPVRQWEVESTRSHRSNEQVEQDQDVENQDQQSRQPPAPLPRALVDCPNTVYQLRNKLMNRSTDPPAAIMSPIPRRRKSIEIEL